MAVPIESPSWIALVTPLAVLGAAIVQKLDAMAVRRRLETSAKARDQKLEAIHGLVNGNMSESLRLSMVQTARIAQLTRDERDVLIAADAERKYQDHVERMLRIDLAAAKSPTALPPETG